ncbi:MAG: hypothetical protein AB1714_20750 [Acidobacteriota bacterium]
MAEDRQSPPWARQVEDWARRFEASAQRINEALAKGHHSHARLVETIAAAASAHIIDRAAERMESRLDRHARREAERRRRREEHRAASLPQGIVFGGAAAAMVFVALTQPGLWWLLFPAFGFAMASTSLIARGLHRRRQAALPAPEAETARPQVPSVSPADKAVAEAIGARLARAEAVCGRILADLKTAPRTVSDVIGTPEKTVESLRQACRDLAKRELELRSAVKAEDDNRLRREHDELDRRIAAEQDEVVRRRLSDALRALDAQISQRADLLTAAARLEAEGTRILYALESLHTQVLRARSADSASADVAGAGLRRGLEKLDHEMDAVASSLEEVNRDDASTASAPEWSDSLESRPPAARPPRVRN